MTRLWVLFVLCCNALFAQNHFDIRWDFADEQFDRGFYEVAAAGYNQLLFFATETEDQAQLNYNIAQCYYQLGAWQLAADYFDYTYNATDQDSLQIEAVFGKTRSIMQMQDWNSALVELASLPDAPHLTAKVALYEGICWFQLEQFDAAQKAFLKVVPEMDTTTRAQINQYFSNRKYLFRPNPSRSFYMSLFFPGSGQLYAGDVKNSLNSIALNGLLLYLSYNVIQNLTVLDALVSFAPWLQRYYYGGAVAAERIATEKREQRRKETFKQVLNVLEGATKP
jgi:tetratricopeptide (TPR) repeat protein